MYECVLSLCKERTYCKIMGGGNLGIVVTLTIGNQMELIMRIN